MTSLPQGHSSKAGVNPSIQSEVDNSSYGADIRTNTGRQAGRERQIVTRSNRQIAGKIDSQI